MLVKGVRPEPFSLSRHIISYASNNSLYSSLGQDTLSEVTILYNAGKMSSVLAKGEEWSLWKCASTLTRGANSGRIHNKDTLCPTGRLNNRENCHPVPLYHLAGSWCARIPNFPSSICSTCDSIYSRQHGTNNCPL